MKQLMIVTVAAMLTLTTQAQRQKDVPEFGKVEKAELEMKECDFDKNADAVVLFDVGELYCNINNIVSVDLERHVRIKILNDKGKDRADIRIRYVGYRNAEMIKNLAAQTYNLDGSGNLIVSKVEKKLIYEKKINKHIYEQVFTFPEVKPGSILEYKYTHTNYELRDWYFQKSMPVMYSRYRLDFPREIEIYEMPACTLPYERNKETKGNRDIHIYSMRNVPALREEPFISCDDDYLQRLQTRLLAINFPSAPRRSLVRNWVQVIKALMEDEDFGVQLKRNIPRTSDLDSALKSITDPYLRMVTVHNYVRKNMEWNGYSDIYAYDGIRAAWKERKGTIGEINMILVNLLKDAGLDCKPLLVSTRDHGRVNTGIAETGQFNKVLAYVTIADRFYVLDATEKFTPAYLIPHEVMFSEALIINKIETFDWGWTVLWDDKQQFRNVMIMRADIDENGLMKGETVINSYDYSRVERLKPLKKGKDEFKNYYFTSSIPGLQLDEIEIENEDIDTLPLIQKMNFKLPVSSSGDYKYFSLNLFTGFEKNPFVADNRFSDVFFGANRRYNFVCNISIPEGYQFEALPKNLRMIMPDTSIAITRMLAASKNQLSARISIEFKKPVYTVDEYPEFKEFFKKLFDLLNEQVAIRKETNP